MLPPVETMLVMYFAILDHMKGYRELWSSGTELKSPFNSTGLVVSCVVFSPVWIVPD